MTDIKDLVVITVTFVVIFFTISIGSTMLDAMHEDFCPTHWVDVGTTVSASTAENPVTAAYWGCCSAWNGTDCNTWDTSSYSANTTIKGSESLEEFSGWGPTLALVVIAAVIIGTLITYLAKKEQ